MSNGPQRRRRLSPDERRERIEAAATRLFSETGYEGASIDAIAQASGITPPVIYDHFLSKADLYRGVLEKHFANLRAIWREGARSGLDPSAFAASVDSWFAYVGSNPEASRLLFREPGDVEAAAIHREVSDRSRDMVMQNLVDAPGGSSLAASKTDLEMTWVVLKGMLQGLALWWVDHPEVERRRVVGLALSFLGGPIVVSMDEPR